MSSFMMKSLKNCVSIICKSHEAIQKCKVFKAEKLKLYPSPDYILFKNIVMVYTIMDC